MHYLRHVPHPKLSLQILQMHRRTRRLGHKFNGFGHNESGMEDEVEDKERLCEACGNSRVLFELAMDEERPEWLVRGPLQSYQQMELEFLLGRWSSFDDPLIYEKVRSGS